MAKRKIHIELSADLHKKVRVKAALDDISIQAFVTRLLAEAVKDLALPTVRQTNSPTQTDGEKQ